MALSEDRKEATSDPIAERAVRRLQSFSSSSPACFCTISTCGPGGGMTV
jgi:hypothetical protein